MAGKRAARVEWGRAKICGGVDVVSTVRVRVPSAYSAGAAWKKPLGLRDVRGLAHAHELLSVDGGKRLRGGPKGA